MEDQKQQIADYYNQTHNHYEKWWRLKDNLSLHYGIWHEDTPNFKTALNNTNHLMWLAAAVEPGAKVLDAGCGVGGAAVFLAQHHQCKVQALTLSEKQIAFGQEKVKQLGLFEYIQFQKQDFTNTNFAANSFDLIWACESVCHCSDKADFIFEAFRLLKPGGRLVIADFFLANSQQDDPRNWIQRWAKTWGVPHFSASKEFQECLISAGFRKTKRQNYTQEISKSAKKMYHAALLGSIPSRLYNLLHPGVSHYAKTHFKSGIYQYKALKAGLWEYQLMSASKPLEQ